jgi:hypothetical protein
MKTNERVDVKLFLNLGTRLRIVDRSTHGTLRGQTSILRHPLRGTQDGLDVVEKE